MNVEMDKRMELRLNALISLKSAIVTGFCEGYEKCDRRCPLFRSEFDSCYWMKTVNAIDKLDCIKHGLVYEPKQEPKNGITTKEQSRFTDIIV